MINLLSVLPTGLPRLVSRNLTRNRPELLEKKPVPVVLQKKRIKKMSWELPRLKLFWAGARKRDPRLGEVMMTERDSRIRIL